MAKATVTGLAIMTLSGLLMSGCSEETGNVRESVLPSKEIIAKVNDLRVLIVLYAEFFEMCKKPGVRCW